MGLICELEKIIIEGRELSQFVTDFVWYLRNLMLMKSAPDPNQILEMSEENLKILAEDCAMCDMNALMRYIRVFSELSGQIKNSTQKRVLTEVALIKLTRPEMETGLDSVLDRIRNIERKLESTSFVSPAVQDSAKASGAASAVVPKGPTEEVKALIKARSEDVIAVKNNWRNILSDFQYSLRPVLSNHMRLGNGGGNKLQLIFWEPTFYDTVVRPENIDAIKTAIADKLGCDMDIEPVLVSDDVNVDDNYDTMEDLVRIEIQEEE